MQLHFFLVMKTLKIYSLSNFQRCSTILISVVNNYSYYVVHYIARFTYLTFYSPICSLYLWVKVFVVYFFGSPCKWEHLSFSDLFHLAWCPQMARHPSFSFIFNEERNWVGAWATELSRVSQKTRRGCASQQDPTRSRDLSGCWVLRETRQRHGQSYRGETSSRHSERKCRVACSIWASDKQRIVCISAFVS